MTGKEETIATYNATATRMTQKFRDYGPRVEDIARGCALVDKEDPFVLEIGCGDGRDAKEILRHTKHYLGIDISKGMIAEARAHVPSATFEVADAEAYAFPQDLDLVFAFASLLHVDKTGVTKILSDVHDVLTPGGVFYISLKHGAYRETYKVDEFGTRTNYFYTPELITELAGSGYETVFDDVQEVREKKWFVIALRKVTPSC